MAGFLDRLRKAFVKQNHPKNKAERSSKKVENKDYLLNQIDEFREKAQQLQTLLISKESKVNELQDIVNEKSVRANELEQVLRERQDKADEITAEFGNRIDAMAQRIETTMKEIQEASEASIEKGRELNEAQVLELKEKVDALTSDLEGLKEGIKESLQGDKAEILEKIHSENVTCYRNIQGLAKEYDADFERIEFIEQNVKSIRGFAKFTTWMSVINFLFLVAFILYSLGVFNFF